MTSNFKTKGSFTYALEYLIKNSNEDVLEMWDKLRGNDWYTGTLSVKECNEFMEYVKLKAKFEE